MHEQPSQLDLGSRAPLPPRVAAPDAAYVCPMHPQVHADQPGNCPLCGMALELSQEQGPAQQPNASGDVDWALHQELRRRGTTWGIGAGAFLVGVYIATLGLANSFSHVFDELGRLWYWMAPLVVGFSVQVGLFTYARRAARAKDSAARAHAVVASGSASTVSMVACCAHHLTDVLPVVGLAGAVSVLATYQSVFLLAGVLSNVVGLVYVLRLLRRHRLFPARVSLLSRLMRIPFDRALVPVVVVAAVVFVAVVLKEIL